MGARRLTLKLPTPLANLFDALPDSLPFPTVTAVKEAHAALFKDVQLEVSSLKRSEIRPETFKQIAQPLADRFLLETEYLSPRAVKSMDYWIASLTVGVIGFLISMSLLCCTGGYLYCSLLKIAAALPEPTSAEAQDSGSATSESHLNPRAAPELTAPRASRPSYAALRQLLYASPPSYASSARLSQMHQPTAPPSVSAL